jgi:hypothetical protein
MYSEFRLETAIANHPIELILTRRGGALCPSDRMLLNNAGKMVAAEWLDLPSRFPLLILDAGGLDYL